MKTRKNKTDVRGHIIDKANMESTYPKSLGFTPLYKKHTAPLTTPLYK